MRWGMVTALAAGLMTLCSCTSAPPPVPAPSAPSPSVSAAPAPSALRLAAAPLWSRESKKYFPGKAPAAPISSVRTTTIVGDAVLMIGHVPEHRGQERLAVLDAATGKLRWSATAHEKVPGGGGILYDYMNAALVGDPAGDWSLVVSYRRKLGGDKVEDGFMGLAGRDGRLLWKFPAQRVTRCSCPWTVSTVALLGPVSATTVLVEMQTDRVKVGTVEERTVAYDPATGRQRWAAKGVTPVRIAGDVVLVHRPKLPEKATDQVPPTLSALDLNTGKPRWDLAGRYPSSQLLGAGAGTVVVATGGDSRAFVDLTTGRELGAAPAELGGCEATDRLFVCDAPAGRAGDDEAALVSRTGDTVTVAPVAGSGRCAPLRVQGDAVLCDGTVGRLPGERAGELKAVGDRYAVLFEKEDYDVGTFKVYARQ